MISPNNPPEDMIHNLDNLGHQFVYMANEKLT